jgi:hypothetical protein
VQNRRRTAGSGQRQASDSGPASPSPPKGS